MCPYCTLLCAHSPSHRIWGVSFLSPSWPCWVSPCYALLLQEHFGDGQCQSWSLRSVTPGLLLSAWQEGSSTTRNCWSQPLIWVRGKHSSRKDRSCCPILVPPQQPGLSILQWVSILMITTTKITSHWSFFGGPLRLRISCIS